LVPTLSEIEWKIKPLIAGWADVASYDASGVGQEPRPDRPGPDTVAELSTTEKPSTSPEFAEALRRFCAELPE
jgi:hypothetical protein